MNIKKVWIPYWEWEDWHAGMWRKVENEDFWIGVAVEFTGNHINYGNAMKEVIKEWPLTMLNRMTDPGINKRAFLGHCAACYALHIPELITRMAWKLLTQEQRDAADSVAQKTIDIWKNRYMRGLRNGNQGATKVDYLMLHLQTL